MGLKEQQNLLARLYTDENLRRAFLSEPFEIGKNFDLNAHEIEEIAAIAPGELDLFADSLFWKRLREAEKFLPATKKILGQRFAEMFRGFSQKYNPQSVKKHLEDAFEFCRYLQNDQKTNSYEKNIARFEQGKLEFFAYGKNFVVKRFEFDVRNVISKNDEFPALKKRPTFAVWLRFGKFVRHRIF